MIPKKVHVKNGYIELNDCERVRRAFEDSGKSAEKIAQEYGLPSADAVRFVVYCSHQGIRADIKRM